RPYGLTLLTPAPLHRVARLPPGYLLAAAGPALRACASRSALPAPGTAWRRSRPRRGAPRPRRAAQTRAAALCASASASRYLPLAAPRRGGSRPRQGRAPPDTSGPDPLSPENGHAALARDGAAVPPRPPPGCSGALRRDRTRRDAH